MQEKEREEGRVYALSVGEPWVSQDATAMGNRSPSCSVLTRAQTASSGKSNTHDSVTVVHTASADRVAATDETTTSSTDVPEADAIVAICGLREGEQVMIVD